MGTAQSSETREISVDVSSRSAEARNEGFQKAIEELSKELAIARLGADFFDKNHSRFDSEILKNSSKYILSVRGKGFRSEENVTKLDVSLGYSADAFDRLLRESGLMQLSRRSLRALILLEDKDRAVGVGPWWARSEAKMPEEVASIFKSLAAQLVSRGIEVASPKSVIQNLPPEFRKSGFAREELVQMGNQLGFTLVFYGLIAPGSKGKIYHGQWVQVPAQRILDEVQGEEAKDSDVVAAVMKPVIEAQTQGTLNAKPFLLTVRGAFTPKQLAKIKDQLGSGIGDLRGMKPQELKRGEFTFKAESAQSPEALVRLLETLSFQDFQHRVSLNDGNEILLQLKKR